MQFVPWRQFSLETLRNGFLPLWNPMLGMGAPLIANYQSAVFYPPNFLMLLFDPAWAHGLLVLIHVLWSGIGIVLLARSLRMGPLAQTIAALAYSMSGYSIARAGFLSINAAMAWLPWIILATDGLARTVNQGWRNKATLKSIIMLGLVLAFQWLAGHAQTAWYSLFLVVLWTCWRGYIEGKLSGLLRSLVGLSLSLFLAFSLAAIQLIPTLEYLLNSFRAAQVDREWALSYSFWPWRFLGFLTPDLFGNPSSGIYWGYSNYWEDAIYIGVLPFILAVIAGIRGLLSKGKDSLNVFLLILAILSFLLALGKNTPVFPFLFDHIPTFNLFQAPTRWTLIAVFCLTLLAGRGAEAWEHGRLIPLYWVRLGTAGAIIAVIFLVIGGRIIYTTRESFVPAILTVSILLGLIGVIAWRRRLRPGPYWAILIGGLVLIDLLWTGKGLNPTAPASLFEGESALVEQVDPSHRLYMPADLEDEIKFDWTHRFDTFNHGIDWNLVRDVGLPNTPMLDDLTSANNFDPLLPARYAEWMEALEELPKDREMELLKLMDVGWKAVMDPQEEDGIRYDEIPGTSRLRFVGQVIWVKDETTALAEVTREGFDPDTQVIIEGTSISQQTVDEVEGSFEIVEQNNPNRLSLTGSTSSGGWLVLSDVMFPGWNVEVDGNESPLFYADYAFKAVFLSPGEHIVEFRYEPISFQLGLVLSPIAWVLTGAVLWFYRKN